MDFYDSKMYPVYKNLAFSYVKIAHVLLLYDVLA